TGTDCDGFRHGVAGVHAEDVAVHQQQVRLACLPGLVGGNSSQCEAGERQGGWQRKCNGPHERTSRAHHPKAIWVGPSPKLGNRPPFVWLEPPAFFASSDLPSEQTGDTDEVPMCSACNSCCGGPGGGAGLCGGCRDPQRSHSPLCCREH